MRKCFGSRFTIPTGLAFSYLVTAVHAATNLFVWTNSPSPAPPYDSWGNAAHEIQTAVDAALLGDTVVVTDGVYRTGGRVATGTLTNRVAVNKAITVRSVNGRDFTVIEGANDPAAGGWPAHMSERCVRGVYLANGTTLDGFTVRNGFASNTGSSEDQNAGGILCEGQEATVLDCTISENQALYAGGGVAGGTLDRCILVSNVVQWLGGGAYGSVLRSCLVSHNQALVDDADFGKGGGVAESSLTNCTVVANRATLQGSGLYRCTAVNSIIYDNLSTHYGVNHYESLLTYSCTTPWPGGDSITNDPHFVNCDAGDYRLQGSSLCIGAGTNQAWMTGATDLAGSPRILGTTVDMGAYEFQGTEFFDLWASAGAHGTITPAGTVRTNQGASVVFTMLPDLYYHVANVTSNGVGVGSITNFTWSQVSAAGTVTVSFAESTAAHGTPLWWLAQYGWTQNLDVVETDDPDGDGLPTWQEYVWHTSPTNANTDGDQFNDGIEVQAGADPLRDDTQNYAAMLSNPAAFGLYTSNSVVDLSFGEMMLSMVTNTVKVRLTLMTTDTLGSTNWSPVGASVEWSSPVVTNKGFFRFLGEASQ